jgi:anti-sigma-K factor RskA
MDTHIEELLAFYALGTLSDEEKEQVEAYLSEHPEVREQIEDLEFAASALPYSVSPVRPSAQSKQKLMARIATDRRAQSSNRSLTPNPRVSGSQSRTGGFPQLAFGVLSLLVAAVALTSMYFLNRQIAQLQNEVSALQTALLSQADTVRQLNVELEQVNARLPLSPPSTLMTFSIHGTAVQPDAHAQLLTDPNSPTAVLVVSGLDVLLPGETYQVWLIQGEVPHSAGLLNVNTQGQGVSILAPEETIASFDALGVSIEPDEGSLQPTGEIVLLGEFN